MDIENRQELLEYLISKKIILDNEEISIAKLEGGVSNRTVKIDFSEKSWVIKQALNKLRVSEGWFSAPERIYHEAEGMRWLNQHFPGITPELVFEDKPHFLLVMQTVPSPFVNLKAHLLKQTPDLKFIESAGSMLGRIHEIGKDVSKIPETLQDTGFFKSLRIKPYYEKVVQNIPSTQAFYQELINESNNSLYTLTHGDFSPKNLLVKDEHLILLDHEVMHFGDGTFDLGFFTTHLLAKSLYRPQLNQVFITGVHRFFEAYKLATNIESAKEQRAVRHTIGCLLARISGLSPLEYLSSEQQQVQQSIALKLMKHPPSSLKQLTSAFKSFFDA